MRGLRVESRAIAEVSRTTQPVVKAQTRGGPRYGDVCDGRPQRAKEPQRDAIARPDNRSRRVRHRPACCASSWRSNQVQRQLVTRRT